MNKLKVSKLEEGKEMPYKKFETPKPVSVGDEIDVTIESVGGQGDGIAKVDGFVVFVKGAAKDERLKVKITDVRRTYAVGEKVGEAAPAEEAPAEEKETAAEEKTEEAPAEEAEKTKE
jgi:predicted RNA-binding protein with TRAM domain